jgi:hypothetical protein
MESFQHAWRMQRVCQISGDGVILQLVKDDAVSGACTRWKPGVPIRLDLRDAYPPLIERQAGCRVQEQWWSFTAEIEHLNNRVGISVK